MQSLSNTKLSFLSKYLFNVDIFVYINFIAMQHMIGIQSSANSYIDIYYTLNRLEYRFYKRNQRLVCNIGTRTRTAV